MNHPDEQDVDPEDIFEEIEPNEPASLDAKIRGGDRDQSVPTVHRAWTSASRRQVRPDAQC